MDISQFKAFEPFDLESLLGLSFSQRESVLRSIVQEAAKAQSCASVNQHTHKTISTSGTAYSVEHIFALMVLHGDFLDRTLVENLRMLYFANDHDKRRSFSHPVQSWRKKEYDEALAKDRAAIVAALGH